jgi:hypothetical protein
MLGHECPHSGSRDPIAGFDLNEHRCARARPNIAQQLLILAGQGPASRWGYRPHADTAGARR